MGNIRLWIMIAFVAVGGAFLIQSLRVKLAKVEASDAAHSAQLNDQKVINDDLQKQIKKIAEIQAGLNQTFIDNENATKIVKSTKYIIDASTTQVLVDLETRDTIRCNAIVGGNPVLDTDKKNTICPELVQ